jgi:hypothetical protein
MYFASRPASSLQNAPIRAASDSLGDAVGPAEGNSPDAP